jgi:thiamine phosphate synthase YjbQ (UPF0047 family)
MILLKSFYIDTTKGLDILNIGHEVRRTLKEADAEDGTVFVMIPHPGAAVAILDPSERIEELKKNLESFRTSGVIHCLLSKSSMIPFEKRRMVIEPWQEIFLIDYEILGKRREFKVQIVAETPQKKEGDGPSF